MSDEKKKRKKHHMTYNVYVYVFSNIVVSYVKTSWYIYVHTHMNLILDHFKQKMQHRV
jgi:hypothetical protein